jgi:hypothetical protein
MKALAETLELSLIGGLLASSVDLLWVCMDILHNGVSAHYVIIFIGLFLATGVLSVSLKRHHQDNYKKEIGMLYKTKLNIAKHKLKRGG